MSLTRLALLTAAVNMAVLVPVPAAAALPPQCSGTAPITCTFAVAPGNYDVAVELGSTNKAANTSMSVEARRQVLNAVPTGQGGTGTAGLQITFGGTAPAIGSLTVTPTSAPLAVYLAGDSGHNDKDTTAAVFRDNLTRLVTGVRERGSVPVLMTPPVRRLITGSTLTGTAVHVNNKGVRELNLPLVSYLR